MNIVRSSNLSEFNLSVVEQTLSDSSHVYDVHIQFTNTENPTIELACISSKSADALFDKLEECVDIRPI